MRPTWQPPTDATVPWRWRRVGPCWCATATNVAISSFALGLLGIGHVVLRSMRYVVGRRLGTRFERVIAHAQRLIDAIIIASAMGAVWAGAGVGAIRWRRWCYLPSVGVVNADYTTWRVLDEWPHPMRANGHVLLTRTNGRRQLVSTDVRLLAQVLGSGHQETRRS